MKTFKRCKGKGKGKGKGKVHPRTDHKGTNGEYSSTLSLTSLLDGVGCQRHATAVLHSGKDPVPIV